MKNMTRIVVSAFLLMFVGCRAHETTISERISTGTHIARVLVDSVVLKDSIVIREKCDTVFYTKYRTLYKERVKVDTVIKCDTVYSERLVSVKEKENGKALWWLIVLLIVVFWKIGVLDFLRNLIMKKIE